MPTLDLTVFNEIEFKLIHLTAVMCWPSESEAKERRTYILQEYLGLAASEYNQIVSEEPGRETEASVHVGKWLAENILPFGGWPALANVTVGPGQKRSPVYAVERRMKQGVIAGWILNEAIRTGCGVHGAANRWAAEVVLKLKREGNKITTSENPDKIENDIWRKFEASAHLWAAFENEKTHKKTYRHRYIPLDQFQPEDKMIERGIGKGLKGFLDLSSLYLAEGRRQIAPTGKKSPILPTETTWEIIY